jgi:hypothetical protein
MPDLLRFHPVDLFWPVWSASERLRCSTLKLALAA